MERQPVEGGVNTHIPKEGEGTSWLFLAYVNRIFIFLKKRKNFLMDKEDVGKYSYYIFNQSINGLTIANAGTFQSDRISTALADAMIKKGLAHHKKDPRTGWPESLHCSLSQNSKCRDWDSGTSL